MVHFENHPEWRGGGVSSAARRRTGTASYSKTANTMMPAGHSGAPRNACIPAQFEVTPVQREDTDLQFVARAGV